MPRNVASNVDTEIAKNAVQPFHIVKIQFASGNTFLSEGPSITFEGNSYNSDTIEVSNVIYDQSGFSSAKLLLPNESGSSVSLALQNQIAGTLCDLYLAYKDSSGSFTTPVLLGSGSLEPSSITQDEVVVKLVNKNQQRFFPNVYCNSDNGFSHLVKSGTFIEWGDEKFELVN